MRAWGLEQALCGAWILALLGCSGDAERSDEGGSFDPSTSTSGSSGSGASSGTGTTGAGGNLPTGTWTTLIEGSWQLDAGSEGYWCATTTLAEDVYIHAFRATAPIGTHHTLLLRSDGSSPDSEFACGATLGHEMYFASGVGSDDLVFPDGVAMRISAGTQLMLNLHLFNSSTSPLSGVSGTQVLALPAAEVEQQAEMVLPGSNDIMIPPQSMASVQGSCPFNATSTIVTVWPHMHQYGTHMTVTHDSASGPVVIHDAPFSFTEQKNYAIPPVTVSAGESIGFVCTWTNTTDNTITFGDSSEAEMCFVGLYRYPPITGNCSPI